MNNDQMLLALQADVDDWPERVKAAGVKTASGSSYRPVARNNAVLRTPDDPQATYDYMLRTWADPDEVHGAAGWYRIIAQAGPELTWEWLMVDETKTYSPLFSDELRARVAAALEADEGTLEWKRVTAARDAAAKADAERIHRIQEEMRSGKRDRLKF